MFYGDVGIWYTLELPQSKPAIRQLSRFLFETHFASLTLKHASFRQTDDCTHGSVVALHCPSAPDP